MDPTEKPEEVSKTQQKKKSQEVQALTKRISALPVKQIEKLNLPKDIFEELLKVPKIKSHTARARHIKYIASLMRSLDELESLKEALDSSIKYLAIGGRIAIISFHSIEDRIVKQFFKDRSISCKCPREYPQCICNTIPSLKILTRKAVTPGKVEVESNSRSRSAKLRVAEKI